MVKVIRGRQVDDVDRVVREQRLERVVHRGDRLRGCTFRRRPDDARDLDPQQAQGVHVHDADESRPDDTRPKHRGHGGVGYAFGRSSSTEATNTSLKPRRPIPTGIRSPVGRNPAFA